MTNPIYVLRTNFGDDSIALIQWAKEANLKHVTVVYIDTGWAASRWAERLKLGESYVRSLGFDYISIKSPITFENTILNRGEFPCSKFQWCSSILKGLPLLDWLNQIDIYGQA